MTLTASVTALVRGSSRGRPSAALSSTSSRPYSGREAGGPDATGLRGRLGPGGPSGRRPFEPEPGHAGGGSELASVTERLEDVLERIAPQWGIRPVPESLRRLRAVDLAVLWGDLSIGLLVLASGALLVPALGLPRAVLAIA